MPKNKSRQFFDVPHIPFEGPRSENPLAFRHYDPAEVIDGVSLKDHMRFSIAYWHSFRGVGSDPFGPGTIRRPWESGKDAVSVAKKRMDAAFEFFVKIEAPFWAFHDRDIAPEAAQVKKAMEVTHELGGDGYTFWGGREGYETLLNTNLKREQDHLARFLHMAVDHAKHIGFKGQFYIEPKPKEPTKHQYDFDVASGIAFLRTYGLEKHLKFNIETNHATLAGHTFQHEIEVAASQGMLGSIDANAGDTLLGWDTDQFNTDVKEITLAMFSILRAGGLGKGGYNFDAKLRRPSVDPEDLFYAHIGGMDTYALAFKTARRIIDDGKLGGFVDERYSSYDSGFGKDIEKGSVGFRELEKLVLTKLGEPVPRSGRQEYLENLVNSYLTGG